MDRQKLLENDIKRWMKTYAEAYCKQAAIELTETAKHAIQKFYDDYNPRYYDRTDDLKDNSYSLYYHNNGKRIYGGVKISAANMSDYKNGTTADDVVGWTWFEGKHGFYDHDMDYPIFTYPPINIVKEKRNDPAFLKKLDNLATKEAQKQSYDVLFKER